MRISDWSSDVCSSDLSYQEAWFSSRLASSSARRASTEYVCASVSERLRPAALVETCELELELVWRRKPSRVLDQFRVSESCCNVPVIRLRSSDAIPTSLSVQDLLRPPLAFAPRSTRSEEHTSELQSLMSH